MTRRILVGLIMVAVARGLHGIPDVHGQARVGVSLAGGYAAGLDTPVLGDGSWGVSGAIFLERKQGVEFGLGLGYDRYEDRTVRTSGLFLDPADNSVRTTNCSGCLAGSIRQRDERVSRYITPMVRIRARRGMLRPWASVGLGLYSLRDRGRRRFVPGAGAERELIDNVTTDLAPGGNLTVGVGIPIGARISIDAVSQLHGALLVGDDFAGGAGYARVGIGVTIR